MELILLVALAVAMFWAYKHKALVKSWFVKSAAPVVAPVVTPPVSTTPAPTAGTQSPPGNAPPAA